jgi:FkbM family methyltransferase
MSEDPAERRQRQSVVEPRDTPPHPVFDAFESWVGPVDPGWDVNFLGVRTRVSFFSVFARLADYPRGCTREAPKPVPNEDYFEWIALLEAVLDAQGSFTMVELGAGWGRWIVNGIGALRAQGNLPYLVVGVEAEPTHFEWMKQHLVDNDVDLRRATLIEGAVADADGDVWFHVGEPGDWYGQRIALPEEVTPETERQREICGRSVARIRAVSLRTVLRNLDRVDLLDVDIQGAEADALEAASDVVNGKVKRMYVGTHDQTNEGRLRRLFGGLEWEGVYDFPGGGVSDTPWGRMTFEDGVQLWVNPAL